MGENVFDKSQCHEIFDNFFGLKDSTCAPYEQAKTVSQIFSFFAKIFDLKVRKSRVPVVKDYWTTRTSKFFFRYGRFHIFKLQYCYWVCKHTHVPFFTCSF